jgi:transglutaminase superfamily protein
MSGPLIIESGVAPPWHLRPVTLAAVGVARLLALLPPYRLRHVLEFVHRGAQPADEATAVRARNAVVAISMRCKGQWCLERSIATALLCRAQGYWPQWCTGIRTHPFQAHAWVAVNGVPIGEDATSIRQFRLTMSVPN